MPMRMPEVSMRTSMRVAAAAGRHGRAVTAVLAALAAALLLCTPRAARAEDAEIQALRQQVLELQQKIEALAQREAARASAPAAAAVATAAAPATRPAAPSATFNAGSVAVTLGGFVELMVVGRSRNEAADWASNYNTAIPYPQSPNYQLSDFRITERQSRWQALAQGLADPNVAAEAYLEGDFGAGPRTASNNEATTFSPRVRHFYADYQRKDAGWYLLFGQTWSLLTQNKRGIIPRQEQIPLTIDGQYVPGFNWTRVPQVRLVKSFGEAFSLGLSAENPAALISANASAGAPAVAPFFSTPGGSGYDANNNITTDPGPDVILKAAFDPGYGHYELYGLNRQFRDRYKAQNQTVSGSAFGGSLILPLVPGLLDFSASGLVGDGIGRYGSAQLPDATVRPDGALATIHGSHYLAGLLFKPTPLLTLYTYIGREHDEATAFTSTVGPKTYGYGYGSDLFNNSNCLTEGSTGNCTANTAAVSQFTLGGWYKFYVGALGNMQVGLQLTHVKREVYPGIGGNPSTDINIGDLSLRYYPYQK
jgi:hypothetical protein